MTILHILDVDLVNNNGVVVAVTNYLKYEMVYCANVALYNLNSLLNSDIKQFSYNKYKKIKLLPQPFNKPDLVIFNEVYKPKYIKLYKECLLEDIPYIIIPHGCLIKKAQHHKFFKKQVANLLLFYRFIKNAKAIQFLNQQEKNHSILKNPNYIIIGNGIEISKEKNKCINKNFIYIGRYDIKVKGLDLLIDTIAKNKNWFINNKVKINLYGQNSGNGYNYLETMILKKNLSRIVVLNDAIYGEKKKKVLLNSYCFIQVSRHEGQPMGIMEALSYGIPCIVTYNTSFGKYVNDNKCGIGIDFDGKELFKAIKSINDDKKLRDDYSKNTKIIENDYEWSKVIKNTITKYKELL